MSKLAINGGTPIRTTFFPSQNTIGQTEIAAVIKVMKRGRLSGYRGNWCPEFMGGPEVQRLEKKWEEKFNTKHAIAVNSCTSGLQVACGAIGLGQDGYEQVVVTPYSMTCSATAPMIYGAVPVFADIEPDNYCLSPASVEARITPFTKAIIVVSLFGQPYDLRINEIAEKHGIPIIEDAAQAIGSFNHEHYAGTLGDIGVYSFNYGKHITCGEGGMIVTDNDDLALCCRLIRNHAEAVVAGMGSEIDLARDARVYKRLVGFNMRMTEIDAAIVQHQLDKFDVLLEQRLANVEYLQRRLEAIPAITATGPRENCTHTYYALPFQWDDQRAEGLHRDRYIEAVKAELKPRMGREGEGVPIGCGYIRPLYTMYLFDKTGDVRCPVCEELSYKKLFLTLYHAPNSTMADMAYVGDAFEKVWEYKKELI
jgi:dTDP-4-amino-4,6-dideoxygalactose transaminase